MSAHTVTPFRYDSLDLSPGTVKRQILDHIRPGSNVLDVGCATGRLAGELSRKRCTVTCVEPDPAMADAASERIPRVFRTTGEDLRQPELYDTFDVAVLADCIEHSPRPDVLLRNIMMYVKPGGVLFVSVPNVAHWTVRLALLRGRFSYAETGILDRTHLAFFVRESFVSLLTSLDLKLLELLYSFWEELLPEYRRGPLGLILWHWRARALFRKTCRLWPTLFAVQFLALCRKPCDSQGLEFGYQAP